MLNIMKACYSNTISEDDLLKLEGAVDCYLKNFMRCFQKPLKPKQHMLTHYAASIRKVGPLVHNSSLRFEMKHKQLKDTIKNSCNFQNVAMSIANRMQLQSTLQECYIDSKKHSVPRRIDEFFFQHFGYLIKDFEDTDDLRSVKNLKLNSNYYDCGLVLKYKQNFEDIRKILIFKGDYYFVCARYIYARFDSFLNSIEIKEAIPNHYSLLKHSELEFKKTHQKIKLNSSFFVLVNSLEVEKN